MKGRVKGRVKGRGEESAGLQDCMVLESIQVPKESIPRNYHLPSQRTLTGSVQQILATAAFVA